MGVIDTVARLAMWDQAQRRAVPVNLANAIAGWNNRLEANRFKDLAKSFLRTGDFTPEGIQRFAQENGLSVEEMSRIIDIVKKFNDYRASRYKVVNTYDEQGRPIQKAVPIDTLQQGVPRPEDLRNVISRKVATSGFRSLTPEEKVVIGITQQPYKPAIKIMYDSKGRPHPIDFNNPKEVAMIQDDWVEPSVFNKRYGKDKVIWRNVLTHDFLALPKGETPPGPNYVREDQYISYINAVKQGANTELSDNLKRYNALVKVLVPLTGNTALMDMTFEDFAQAMDSGQLKSRMDILQDAANSDNPAVAALAKKALQYLVNIAGITANDVEKSQKQEQKAISPNEMEPNRWYQMDDGKSYVMKLDDGRYMIKRKK